MDVCAKDLDELVSIIDDKFSGNSGSEIFIREYLPINLKFLTHVDQGIDPFSEEYVSQQIALYCEISGRQLSQENGELHPVNIEELIDAPNPQGILNVSHISENVRALSGMLSLSRIQGKASILDLGAGHGLSSEIYASCGAKVHAVDIDPELSKLSSIRSIRRGLDINRIVMNFDNLAMLPDDSFDAAFFFQSFHHCIRPWELLCTLKNKLKSGGVIGFTGEPVQKLWWKNWGLRFDHESLYVARKYGWFESGWSLTFINECFKRNGFHTKFFKNGHGGGLTALASLDEGKIQEIANYASSMSVDEFTVYTCLPSQFHSRVGLRTTLNGKPAFKTDSRQEGGFLSFGPYITLPAGRHSVFFLIRADSTLSGSAMCEITFDVVQDSGTVPRVKERLAIPVGQTVFIERDFTLGSEAYDIEARIIVSRGSCVVCTHPEFSAGGGL